ncbi:MAG TPA: Hpt domain-containing protein [Thermoanaerobaculia bacterium]|nr:Hpt domain-containing protein [Thermoanaerobaculia bacterium]
MSLADAFEELRGLFRESTRTRIDEMSRCLDALETNARDASALRVFARHVHGLAGLGTTYGYPRISELAEDAEEQIGRGEILLERWRASVEEIKREL